MLLLTVFTVPAKRVGRHLQELTRQQMELNASMNTTTTERFNVSGALLVKLFGRTDQETEDFRKRADGVRRVGVRSAVYGDRKSTRLNSSHSCASRMPSSA